MIRKRKESTATSLLFDYLKLIDDFRTSRQLQAEVGVNSNRTSAALIHLKKYRAVDCLSSGGELWWYATPDDDTRTKTIDERTPESKPRRPRKPKARSPK